MTLEIWIAFAFANFISAVAPGQNVALVGASTARIGARGGYIALCGILIADFMWCLIALGLALGAKNISSDVLLTVQILSGFILVLLGLKIIRSTSTISAMPNAKTKTSPAKLVLSGICIGFANPLTLVFFLTLFPAFMPEQTNGASLGIAVFFSSAVILSGFAALFPYILASFALSKAGLSKALNIVSGGSLAAVGGMVLAYSVA
ncbi:LysE family translocator [Planktotalea sp.]|uniref:LysE family translocator n=1 Tax=Planktotalea sp. TaxID=2029877 RepID=UPI003D6C49BA